MPTLRIQDVPEDIYQALLVAARAEQRSLSQQVIVDLRRALALGTNERRAATVQQLRNSARRLPVSATSPETLQRKARDSR